MRSAFGVDHISKSEEGLSENDAITMRELRRKRKKKISKKLGVTPMLAKPQLARKTAAQMSSANAMNYLKGASADPRSPQAQGLMGAAKWHQKYAAAASKNNVSKRKEVHEDLKPLLPSTTVDAYNNSRYNKKKAAGHNLAAKAIGATAGFAGGYVGYRALKGKLPILAKPSRIPVPKRKVPVWVSGEKKQGIAASTLTGAGSTVGGYYGSKKSLEHIKNKREYRYQASNG